MRETMHGSESPGIEVQRHNTNTNRGWFLAGCTSFGAGKKSTRSGNATTEPTTRWCPRRRGWAGPPAVSLFSRTGSVSFIGTIDRDRFFCFFVFLFRHFNLIPTSAHKGSSLGGYICESHGHRNISVTCLVFFYRMSIGFGISTAHRFFMELLLTHALVLSVEGKRHKTKVTFYRDSNPLNFDQQWRRRQPTP